MSSVPQDCAYFGGKMHSTGSIARGFKTPAAVVRTVGGSGRVCVCPTALTLSV